MWLFLLNKEHFLAAYIFHILVTEWKVPCSKDQYKVWYFDFIYLQKNWRSRAHDKPSGSEFGLQQHWTSSTLDGKEAQIPSYYKSTEKQDILSRYNFVNRVFKTANQQKVIKLIVHPQMKKTKDILKNVSMFLSVHWKSKYTKTVWLQTFFKISPFVFGSKSYRFGSKGE